MQQPGAGLNCTTMPSLPPKLEATHEEQRSCRGIKIRTKKTLTQLCNPTAGSRVPRLQCYQARFQGYNVIRQDSKVLQGSKIPQLQVSRVARLQMSRVPRFQSSKLPRFWGSKFPGFKVPRFQTCKGLGLIHQRGNDQRNAMQTQNTIELLQFI